MSSILIRLLALFIQFLTKQTESYICASMGGKLKILEKKLSKQINETETVVVVKGQKAPNKLDALFAKNLSLVKP